MGKKIDLTGQRFGDIEIIGIDENRTNIEIERKNNGEIKTAKEYLLCKCLKCGNIFSRCKDNIKFQKKMCPSCSNKELSKDKSFNVIGKTFGRLKVVSLNKVDIKKTKERNIKNYYYD